MHHILKEKGEDSADNHPDDSHHKEEDGQHDLHGPGQKGHHAKEGHQDRQ